MKWWIGSTAKNLRNLKSRLIVYAVDLNYISLNQLLMKSTLLLLSALLFSSLSIGQVQCTGQSNELVLSTGYNPVSSNLINDYGLDPMWRLVQAPADPVGWTSNIGGPAIVIPITNSWSYAGQQSKYLNAYPTAQALTDNWSLATTPYIFEREFCICITDPNTPTIDVVFNLSLNADNWAELELVDDLGNVTPLVAQPYVYSTANFQNTPAQAVLTLPLSTGIYTLRLSHRNKLVVMGVNLDAKIFSNALLSDNECIRTCSVAGFIHEDSNQSGAFEDSDAAIAGRTMSLYDDNNSLISTAITDHSGYYFFMDLEPGTYTVEGEVLPNWSYLTPQNGSLTVSADTNVVGMASFLAVNAENSISELAVNNFSIAPNPNNGAFQLMFNNDTGDLKDITIYNQVGQIISELITLDQSVNIDLSSIKPGVYLIRVNSGGQSSTQRFIVK